MTTNQAIYNDLYKEVIRELKFVTDMDRVIGMHNVPWTTISKVIKRYGHAYMVDFQKLLYLQEEYHKRPNGRNTYDDYIKATEKVGEKICHDLKDKIKG